MPELFLRGQRAVSIFQLLGDHENDISYSVGLALAKCPTFLRIVLRRLVGWEGSTEDVQVRLQQWEPAGVGTMAEGSRPETATSIAIGTSARRGGITDIEITHPADFFIIIEAKRGRCVPAAAQLDKYALRESLVKSRANRKKIVVASECSKEYALANLPFTTVHGIPVDAVSWKSLQDFAVAAARQGTHAEKRLLGQLTIYLRGLMTMQRLDSNWVYVVSLRDATEAGWSISWTDVVNLRRRYFHPVGTNGWPASPPNYIAFRYGGRLRSIHHIEDYEIIKDLHSRFEEIPSRDVGPHFIYSLGEGFAPSKELPTGNVYPSGRVRCMLDTLFTASTIAEARDISKMREAKLGLP